MPIPFTCPHCGLKTDVLEQYTGQSGPCAGCGRTVTVPPLADALNYAPPTKRSAAPVVVLIVVLVLLVLLTLTCVGLWVVVPMTAVPSAREAARRTQCANNLKQIGLAMHNYHDAYGCFPPAYVADEDGRPMHSWRVLLLPFLEEGPLYEQYNLDEPWDSPQNLALAAAMPQVYRCPSDARSVASETSYLMIVGARTISDGPKATKIAEITDGMSDTILLVESAGSGINWLDPRDLDADQISYLINDPVDGGITSDHPTGVNVLFADGSVMFLDGAVDSEEIKAMGTISGGESVDKDSAQYGGGDW